MFKIQTLIFFALISFSLQDSNCLVYYEKCEEQEEAYPVKIANCKFGYLDDDGKEICDFWRGKLWSIFIEIHKRTRDFFIRVYCF